MRAASFHSMFRRLGVFVAIASLFAGTAGATDIVGTIGKVIDGDTFWLCDADRCQKVRICGIDAPERGRPGSNMARDRMEKLVIGKTVRCRQVDEGTPCDGRSKRSTMTAW